MLPLVSSTTAARAAMPMIVKSASCTRRAPVEPIPPPKPPLRSFIVPRMPGSRSPSEYARYRFLRRVRIVRRFADDRVYARLPDRPSPRQVQRRWLEAADALRAAAALAMHLPL